MSWLVIALLLGLACGFLFWFGNRGAKVQVERLQAAFRGDRAQAERLLEYELKRAPGISREEAATRATQSLRRDNS